MMMVCHPRFATTRHAFSMCWPYQSMTLCTELHASLNISKALPHTLMHHVVDSVDCTITVLPPASMPLHVPLLVCLFVYLFTFVIGTCVVFFVCLFPLPVVSNIDSQQADTTSNCAHCIRRGLGRSLRSSLLLSLSPRCELPCRVVHLTF